MSRYTRNLVLLGLAAAIALSPFAIAAVAPPPTIVVRNAWMRPAAAGAGAAAYLTVMNRGGAPDVLLSAASSDAGNVSVHESRRVGQIMTMRSVPSLPIKAGGTIRFAPEGLHLMIQGLKRPFKPGDRLVLVLTFARAGRVHTRVAVRPDASSDSMAGMKM